MGGLITDISHGRFDDGLLMHATDKGFCQQMLWPITNKVISTWVFGSS
jgi:hypothetical protein